jgi:hypothetical protein
MNSCIARLCQRQELSKQLRTYGFTRTFGARHGGWLFIATVIIITAFAGVAIRYLPFNLSGTEVMTALVALGAVILGYQQWRAARNEISLDKFYERLEMTNQRLDEWPIARLLAGPWPIPADHQHRDEHELYHLAMYTYRELDNLEYAIAKYKLGYMSSENALRSARTFQARCIASPEFRELAINCAKANCGYDPNTIVVVEKIVESHKVVPPIVSQSRTGQTREQSERSLSFDKERES